MLTLSQTTSPPTRTSVSSEKVLPLGCGCSLVGRTRIVSSSSIPIGRFWAIEFSTWTRPTAPNGKRPSLITAMCSGKASMCG